MARRSNTEKQRRHLLGCNIVFAGAVVALLVIAPRAADLLGRVPWWAGVCALLALLVAFEAGLGILGRFFGDTRPVARAVSQIQFCWLHGMDGMWVAIQDVRTRRRLAFVKHIPKGSLPVFQMIVERDRMSIEEYEAILKMVRESGAAWEMVKGRGGRSERLIVHFDENLTLAMTIARRIFTECFGLSLEAPLRRLEAGRADILCPVGWSEDVIRNHDGVLAGFRGRGFGLWRRSMP